MDVGRAGRAAPSDRTTGLLRAAIEDNVRWVAAVAQAHGVAGGMVGTVWSAAAATPDGYPEAVTTVPGTPADAVVAALPEVSGPRSVKDSRADVDLGASGFNLLFEASWVAHPPAAPTGDGGWWRVRDPTLLRAWQQAWGTGEGPGPFVPPLLDQPGVVLLGRGNSAAPAACAVATLGRNAVGVSNIVWGGREPAWDGLLTMLATLAPGRPVVGYEHGTALAQVRAAGFDVLGQLRVWAEP